MKRVILSDSFPKDHLLPLVAGYFEGEGCITCTKTGVSWSLRIKNTDKQLLDRAVECLGGRVLGPYNETTGKSYYQWYIGHTEGIWNAINLLWPYLTERRRDQVLEVVAQRQDYLDNRVRPRRNVGERVAA